MLLLLISVQVTHNISLSRNKNEKFNRWNKLKTFKIYWQQIILFFHCILWHYRYSPTCDQVVRALVVRSSYIIKCSQMYHGKYTRDFCRLAFKMTKKISSQFLHPEKKDIDWLCWFFKRNPSTLPIRQPEGYSVSRVTSFNKHSLMFFYSLADALKRFPEFSDGRKIWNLDKTGTTTVQNPKKIIAQKGCGKLLVLTEDIL